jgi:protein TonB
MTDAIQPSTNAQLQDDAPRRGATPLLWILLAVALLALAWWLMTQRNLGAASVDTTAATAATAAAESTAPAAAPARNAAKRSSASARASARGSAGASAAASSLSAALLAHDTPRYPTAALRSGTEGTVMLRIAVDANGVPTDIGYAQRSGDRDLDRAALQAAQDWRFRPARRDGRAVASTVNVPVRFTLPASARG